MTDKFKQECKNMAYKNRLGKIELDNETISNSDYLSSFEIIDSCTSNGTILGNTNSKSIKVNTLNNYDLADRQIDAFIGVKYDDSSEEHIKMGKYTISSETNDKTAKNGEYIGVDILNNLNDKYICNIEDLSNAKIIDFYIDVCNQLNLIPKKLNFINSEILVGGNPFTNNESCRIVLQNIAQVFCSFVDIDWETEEIDLIWFDEEISETFTKNDYSTLEKNQVYGPINSVVIKESIIEGENVVREDTESIAINGECQISIEDNYFLYTEDLRTQAIDNIYNRLKGFTYVDCKITSYTGKPYLKRGNKIKIQNDDGTYFDTYVLSHTFTYDGTFKSVIESPALTKTQTTMKNQQNISSKFRRVERICNKIDGKIVDVIEEVDIVKDDLNNNYYTIQKTNELIQSSGDGITNTFSEAGGNNIFRNTGLWFEETGKTVNYIYPSKNLFPANNTYALAQVAWEYWTGNAIKISNEQATLNTAIRLQVGIFRQEQDVPNGNYSISFMYKKLIPLAKTTVTINDKVYDLNNTEWTQFYTGQQDEDGNYITFPVEVTARHISISFYSDVNNAIDIYDLMCNKGTVKLAYSQNENEVTTDTVNISKGITITSSTTDTKFKANSDGIRVLNSNNDERITEFTDKGMTTKEAIVENEATIVKVLIQDINEQTWFTRI